MAKTTGARRESPTAPAPAAKPKERLIKVRATKMGYMGLRRRRAGEVFNCPESRLSLERTVRGHPLGWMELVDPNERVTTPIGPKQAIKKEHDEILASRVPGAGADDDPLSD